jgi:multimeric flavodoxin WrbA
VKIEYYHDSKWGHGVTIAEEFKKQISAKGASVDIHPVKDSKANKLPVADLFIFSSPGRWGGPTWRVTRFLKKLKLPKGTKYAVFTTEGAAEPNKKTGKMPTEEEQAKWHKIIPKMNKILEGKGLVKVAEGKVLVHEMKGPIEEGWQKKVEAFVAAIPLA